MTNRLESLRKFLSEDPEDSFTKYALALEYMRLAEMNQAASWFENIIETDPSYLPVYYQLGSVYEAIHKAEKAITIYRQGINIAREKKDQKTLNELRTALESLEERDSDG